MTTPDDQHPSARLTRHEIEVPVSPEEAWEAVATGAGHTAWLFPADIEPKDGGAMVIHRGIFGGDAPVVVTGWEPPHRFAFEERGPEGSGMPPMVTEFLVEARDAGTCVIRVVNGFLRDGEGWEGMIEGAGEGWNGALIILRGYLTHFAGQPAVGFDATHFSGRPLEDRTKLAEVLFDQLGLTGLSRGEPFRMPDGLPQVAGVVETAEEHGIQAADHGVLLRATEPCPGLYEVSTFSMDGQTTTIHVSGRLYGPDGPDVAERDLPLWNAWLATLAKA